MTMPSPPAVSSGDFGGILVPRDVQARIINLLIEQAAFGNSITRLPTSAGEVAFPVAAPSGAAWIGELARIPLMSLNDRAEIVAVAKLAGLLDVSNEMVSDSAINITAQFTTLLRDSLSKQLDDGLLNGGGPPEPKGVIDAAAEVDGAGPAGRSARGARRDRRRGRLADHRRRIGRDAGRRRRNPRRQRGADVPGRVRRRRRADPGHGARAGHAAGL